MSVSALLSDCDTARKIAERPKQKLAPVLATDLSARTETGRDEAAARVMSVAAFTLRQILFLVLLYAPHIAAFLAIVAYGEIGSFFLTTSYWGFIAVGFLLYAIGLALPFAMLLWVRVLRIALTPLGLADAPVPGSYPKWSHMHLRIWCIGRLQGVVLRPLFAIFRSPRLTAHVLRRLGATVGEDTECANAVQFSGPLSLLSIADEVAIQTSAQIQMARWSGQMLEIGRVTLRRGCKIGMQASVSHGVVVGEGAWVTPLTPALTDVGPNEIHEGAPARAVGQCTKLCRPERHIRSSLPPWLEEATNITMQSLLDFILLVAPASTAVWGARFLFPQGAEETSGSYFLTAPIGEVVGHTVLFAFATTGSACCCRLFLRVCFCA